MPVQDPPSYPHVPAAFINALAEEGTKEEVIGYLQRYWNEVCYLRSLRVELTANKHLNAEVAREKLVFIEQMTEAIRDPSEEAFKAFDAGFKQQLALRHKHRFNPHPPEAARKSAEEVGLRAMLKVIFK